MSTLALRRPKDLDLRRPLLRAIATTEGVGPFFARIALGGVMLPHAVQKAFGWLGGHGFDGTIGFMTSKLGIPLPLAVAAIIGELVGAVLLISGTFARLGALLIATIMTVAVLAVHVPHGFFMNWYGTQAGEGFEYHLLALGLALVTLACGAGKWSVDARLASET